MSKMTNEFATKVYELLVSIGGASAEDVDNFVYHHTEAKDECTEWRFCGKLGFGGKYRSLTNTVDCYSEDATVERIQLMEQLNRELEKLRDRA